MLLEVTMVTSQDRLSFLSIINTFCMVLKVLYKPCTSSEFFFFFLNNKTNREHWNHSQQSEMIFPDIDYFSFSSPVLLCVISLWSIHQGTILTTGSKNTVNLFFAFFFLVWTRIVKELPTTYVLLSERQCHLLRLANRD